MTLTVWMYLVYLLASIGLAVWVARTLHENGRIFLVDAFSGNEALADSVNHLLVVGFYLVNIGYISLVLRERAPIDDIQGVIEILSAKMGVVLLVLGGMHFFNLWIFSRMRRRGLRNNATPPVLPQGKVETPATPY